MVRRKRLRHKAIDRNNQLALIAHSIHLRTDTLNHLHRLDDILVLLARQTNHIIQLDVAHTGAGRQLNRIIHMLLCNALVNRCSHTLAASLRRHRHRALSAERQSVRNLLCQHICTHAGHRKGNLMLHKIFRQLGHLRMVRNGCTHQADLFRALRTLGNIRQNLLQCTRTRLAEAIACHAEAAMTPTAASHLDDIHILELRPARHNRGRMRKGVDITHPLTRHRLRHACCSLQTGELALVIVLRRIKARHINAWQLRQRQQTLLLAVLSINLIQNMLHRLLALADNKGISHGSQRLGIKRCARPADNHQRLTRIALRCTQLHVAQIQHRHEIIIIHLERHHHKNNIEICQRSAAFNAQQRRFALDMLLLQLFIRQEEALAGTVAARINELIKNVHAQV